MKTVYVHLPQSETTYIKNLLNEFAQEYIFIFDQNFSPIDSNQIFMKFSEPKGLFRHNYELEFFPHNHLPYDLKTIIIGQSYGGDVKAIKHILEIIPIYESQTTVKTFVGGQNLQVIGIAASTGGPQALMQVVPSIPDFVKMPIFITQHMQANLLPAFCRQLSELLPSRNVYLAEEGMLITPKSVYIAPGDRHLQIKKTEHLCCTLSNGPLIHYVKPAADPMLESLAETFPVGSVLGVILTGMGHDGIEGSKAIVARKGVVIAQDEETSVVWGMPKTVIDANLAHYILPLERIGIVIGNICQYSKEKYHD